MVSISGLWLPILLSGVLVFVVSSIIHMALKYHSKDYLQLPDEEAARAVLGKQDLAPGQYAVPFAGSMKAMQAPEVQRKYQEGPVAFLTVFPKGPMKIGARLVQWFLFSIGIAVFVAYLTSRSLTPSTPYMQVFRFSGTIAFLGYGGALVWSGIWKGVPWSKVWLDVFDSLVYALVTAGAFAGFWPH